MFNKGDNYLRKSNIYYTINVCIVFYISILIILNYMVSINLKHSLFSIVFLGWCIKYFLKYKRNLELINLLEFIACLVAFIGLLILMFT